jgi:hypothetical protein
MFDQLFPLALTIILSILDAVIKNPASREKYLRQVAKVYKYIGLAYATMPEFQALVGIAPAPVPVDPPKPAQVPDPVPKLVPRTEAPAPVDPPQPGAILEHSASCVTQ